MRKIEIREDDDSLFGNKLTTAAYNCFATYVADLRRIVQQQPTGFWIAFITSFRAYALKNYDLKDPRDIHFISLLKTLTDSNSVCDFYVIIEAVKRYCTSNRYKDGDIAQEVKEDYETDNSIPNVVILYVHFVTALVEIYYRYAKAPTVRRMSSLALWKPPAFWGITLEYPRGSYEDYLRQTWGTQLPKLLRINKSSVPWLFPKEDVSLLEKFSDIHDFDSEVQEINSKVRSIYISVSNRRRKTENIVFDGKPSVYFIGNSGLLFSSSEESKDEILQKKFRRRKKNKSRRNEIDCTINTVNSFEEMHLKSELFGSCDSFDDCSDSTEGSQKLKTDDNIVNKHLTKPNKISSHNNRQFVINEKCDSVDNNEVPHFEFIGSRHSIKSVEVNTQDVKISSESCNVSPKESCNVSPKESCNVSPKFSANQNTKVNNTENQKTLIFHSTEMSCNKSSKLKSKKEKKKNKSVSKFSFSLDITPDCKQSANKKDNEKVWSKNKTDEKFRSKNRTDEKFQSKNKTDEKFQSKNKTDEKFQSKNKTSKSVNSKVSNEECITVSKSPESYVSYFEEVFSSAIKSGDSQMPKKGDILLDVECVSEKKAEINRKECKKKKHEKVNEIENIKIENYEKPKSSKTKSLSNKVQSSQSHENSQSCTDKSNHSKKAENGKNKKNKKKIPENNHKAQKFEQSAEKCIVSNYDVCQLKEETVITVNDGCKKNGITASVEQTKAKNGIISPKKERIAATCIKKQSPKNGMISTKKERIVATCIKKESPKNGMISPKKERIAATRIKKESPKNGMINLPIEKSDFDTTYIFQGPEPVLNAASKINSDVSINNVEYSSVKEGECVKENFRKSKPTSEYDHTPKKIEDCDYEIIDLTVPQTTFKFPFRRNNIGPMMERINEDTMFSSLRDFARKRPKQNLCLLRKCDICKELESESGLWKRCFHCLQFSDTPRVYCSELCCSFDWDQGHSACHT